ncbi:ABC transporter substrate-binding protein [Vibrio aerogenes]|nr:ABC transporter substrate-binding protein [Vibrio aerogenes]
MCILRHVANNAAKKNPDINFIFAENDRSAVGSMNAAFTLVKQHADLVLLPLISHEAGPAAQILSDAHIPFITTATSLSVLKPAFHGLSTMPSSREQARALAIYYMNNFRGRRIHVVINPAKEYSVSVARLFTQEVILHSPETKITEQEFSPQRASRIAKSVTGNEIVFAALYNPDIAILYTALTADKKRETTIIGPDSIGARKEFFAIAGKAREQVQMQYLSNWDHRVKGPHADDFNAYLKAFCNDKKPTFLTVYSYDLIHLVLAQLPQLRRAESPSDTINILRQSPYITVMDGKKMKFTAPGYNQKNLYLYRIKDNHTELLQALNYAGL